MSSNRVSKQNLTENEDTDGQMQVASGKKARTIDPEKQKQYKEKKKKVEAEIRAKRKEEKRNGTENTRRLAFLANIIAASKYTMADMAKLCGKKQQQLYWYFSMSDDMRLSTAQQILDSIGIELNVKLNKLGPIKRPNYSYTMTASNRDDNVQMRIVGDEKLLQTFETDPYLPAFIEDCQEDKRLYFLAEYLKSLKISIMELSRNVLDIDPTSLKWAFDHDDIKISKIMDIATRTNAEIVWNVKRTAPAPKVRINHKIKKK